MRVRVRLLVTPEFAASGVPRAADAHEPGRDWITAKAPATTLYRLLSQTLAALKTL